MARKTAFLVELKTDMSSINTIQKGYLCKALKSGFAQLICGVVKICKRSNCKRQKYVHLLHRLAKLKLVTIPNQDDLYEWTFPKVKPYWNRRFDRVKPCEGKLEHTQVIYIQPYKDKPGRTTSESNEGFKYIYFEDVAKIVQCFGDLGSDFAHYLRKWSEDPGLCDPRTVAH